MPKFRKALADVAARRRVTTETVRMVGGGGATCHTTEPGMIEHMRMVEWADLKR